MKHFLGISCVFLAFTYFPFSVRAGDILPREIASGVPKERMMSAWLRKEAGIALKRRETAFEELETEQDLAKWQKDRRDFFRKQLGGFPEKGRLAPVITGKLEFDDYRIEKLYFESQSGFHVTANLYIPKGKGPFPAVLHPTGHSANAKNRDVYQFASITIARAGCAVLCYDPVGQGERDQVFKPDGSPFGSTLQHTLISQGAHLLGSNTARLMIWDGMRAIDYLQSRSDMIPGKIGCTGISGGGTNTSYLMALDDRIFAAAPGCYLTGFRSLFDSIGPQDAEQNIHGQVAFGMDHSDYVLMRLPKPTLIMAATHDYFDIGGAWRLFREGKRFATRLGFSDRVDLVEPDTKHGFPAGMRMGAANWMRRWLLDSEALLREEKEQHAVPEEELNVLPDAQVLGLEGARSAFDLHKAWCEKFSANRAANIKPENKKQLLGKIRSLINARQLDQLPVPKVEEVEGGYIITPEPGIYLPARLIGNVESEADEIALFLNGKGIQHAEESGTAVRLGKKTGRPVLLVDPRGLGETHPGPGRKGDWTTFVGADWKDFFGASLLGKSFVGMRSEDIWQTISVWRKKADKPGLKFHLIASGEAAIPALHAAALEPEFFSRVTVYDCIDSWEKVVENPAALTEQQSGLVFGALREYDLPVLRQIIEENLPFSSQPPETE